MMNSKENPISLKASSTSPEKLLSTSYLAQKVLQDPIYFLAFGFGSGLSPFAPGTAGTLAAIPLYLIIAHSSWAFYTTITLFFFGLGIWLCNRVSVDLGVHDYGGIVWDEVVGYLVTMFAVPYGVGWIILGFLLFRLFDIWKPQPIRWMDQHIMGGFGIMVDDIAAALPAWGILQLLAWGLGA